MPPDMWSVPLVTALSLPQGATLLASLVEMVIIFTCFALIFRPSVWLLSDVTTVKLGICKIVTVKQQTLWLIFMSLSFFSRDTFCENVWTELGTRCSIVYHFFGRGTSCSFCTLVQLVFIVLRRTFSIAKYFSFKKEKCNTTCANTLPPTKVNRSSSIIFKYFFISWH